MTMAFLIRIRVVPSSNLGPETGFRSDPQLTPANTASATN